MAIPSDKIEQVRLASDIVDVVSGYLTLRQRGKNHFGLCPFHQEKTPSFSVNPELQIFHCFGCGAGGNVFTFIMRIERLTFPESVRLLAKAAGITIPEEEEDRESLQEKEALYYANKFAHDWFQLQLQESPEAEAARRYLASRGLSLEVCLNYGIGYALNRWDGLLSQARQKSLNPDILLKAGLVLQKENGDYYDRFRGRVTFAIHNLSNQVVAFGARRMTEDKSPKYVNSPETEIYQKRLVLYGLHLSRESVRQKNQAVIVEGYTDFISLHRSGATNVVATSGTALTDDHARTLRRYTANTIILYDGDSAGAAASLRGADILLTNGFDVRICLLPSGRDPDEYVRLEGAEAVQRRIAAAVPLMEYRVQLLEKQGLLRTPNQRAEAIRDLLGSVALIGDAMKKAFVVRDLAEKLNMEEALLWAEVRKLERRSRLQIKTEESAETATVPGDFFLNRRGAAELGLLEVVLLQPDRVGSIVGAIQSDEFLHPEIREIFRMIELDFIEGSPYDPGRYISNLRDPYIAGQISGALQRTQTAHANPDRYAFDCLNVIRISKLDEQIDELRKRIQSDRAAAKELLARYQELVTERQRLAQIDFALE